MALNTNIDTSDLERIDPPVLRIGPPLDVTSQKNPYYIAQFPISSTVSADTARNFAVNGIPSYRISVPPPLNMSGATLNATPTPAVVPILQQPTPAPTIVSPLQSIAAGYSFSFREIQLPLGDNFTISTYRVYRSTANNSATATVIQTVPHNPTQAGSPVVITDNVPNGQTRFYFVSAINSRGVESSLTAAQSGPVANTAGFNANSILAGSFHNNALNVSFAPTSTTVLSNNTSTTAVTVAASTNQFGTGTLSYNSGTADLGQFGAQFVYADDPLYQGGAVAYHAVNLTPSLQTAAEGRMIFGKITTNLTTSTSGGGTTGGTTGTGAGGGRGYIQS